MSERPPFFVETVSITDQKQAFAVMGRAEPFYQELEILDPGRKFQDFNSYVAPGAEAVFLTTTGPNPVDMAVVIQRLVPIEFEGEKYNVLARYLRVVKKEFQDSKLGPVLTNEPIQRLNPDFVTARTFNPYIFRVEEGSPYIGEHAITPIHDEKLYSPRTRGLLIATFGSDAMEVTESDPETGLCVNVYPPRNEGVFDLVDASPRVLDIYSRMRALGFSLRRGDGIRYFAEVTPPRGLNRFNYDYSDSNGHRPVLMAVA